MHTISWVHFFHSATIERHLSAICLLSIFTLLPDLSAQTFEFLWARQAGGPAIPGARRSELLSSLTLAPNGEMVVLGEYRAGVEPDDDWRQGDHITFARYDSNGRVIWAVGASGDLATVGYSISSDEAGNFYAAGQLSTGARFGNQTIVLPSRPLGNVDAFLTKLSPAGTFLWTRNLGTLADDAGYAVAVDHRGSCYLAGSYDRNSFGLGDVFLAKYDADGNQQWLIRYGGAGDERALALALAADGTIFLAGYFNEAAQFGNFQLVSAGAQDAFLVKLDSQGVPLWAKRFGDAGTDLASGVAVSADGSAYMTGLTNAGSGEFLQKHSSEGAVLWTRPDGGGVVALDSLGNVYASSYSAVRHTIFSSSSINYATNLISIYSPAGELAGAVTVAGSRTNYVAAIAHDSAGILHVGGWFAGTNTFGDTTLISRGDDLFVANLRSQRPYLSARIENRGLRLNWPTNYANFALQVAPSLEPAAWQPFNGLISVESGSHRADLPLAFSHQFFRLSN